MITSDLTAMIKRIASVELWRDGYPNGPDIPPGRIAISPDDVRACRAYLASPAPQARVTKALNVQSVSALVESLIHFGPSADGAVERDLRAAVAALEAASAIPVQGEADVCPECKGVGSECDYVGYDMRPVEVSCSRCDGLGILSAQGEAKPFGWVDKTRTVFVRSEPKADLFLERNGWTAVYAPPSTAPLSPVDGAAAREDAARICDQIAAEYIKWGKPTRSHDLSMMAQAAQECAKTIRALAAPPLPQDGKEARDAD